ncbi:MAG TPA: TonB-dependent receptor [Myxococcaceae bacterium]|nr:TonB-dependent receptor [Myxococcaceae bacterium]
MSGLVIALAATLLAAGAQPGDARVSAVAQATAQPAAPEAIAAGQDAAPGQDVAGDASPAEAERSTPSEATPSVESGTGTATAALPGADAQGAEQPLVGETVVTASRAPRLRSEVPADVTVLDRTDLEQSASPLLDDILRRVPDVGTFRRSSSRVADPSSQGLNLRGVGPSGVSRALVLVDGLPLNDPFGGWVYWQSVPGLSIGSIEIVPGGTSALYGTAALGGVINVRSRPLDPASVEADVFGDTLPSLGIGLRGVQRAGPVAVELTSEFLGSNGYNVVAPEQRGPIDVPAGSTHITLQSRVQAELSPRTRMGVKLGFFDEHQNGGTQYTNAAAQVRSLAVTLGLGNPDAPEVELAAWFRNEVFRQQRARVGDNRATEALAGEQRVPADDEGFSAVWHAPRWGVQTFDLGLDLHRISGTSAERLFPPAVSPTSTLERVGSGLQLSAGVFVQDTLHLGPVTLVGALRLDHWHNEQGQLRITTPSGENVQDFESRHETELSPRLGVLWRVLDTLSLRGSVNRAFRAPTLNELYRPFQVGTVVTQANPGLSAETLVGAELGVEWSPIPALRSRATGFWNRLENPIINVTLPQTVPPSPVQRQRQNVGVARVQGVELGLEVRPARGWELRAAYTLVDSRVLEADEAPLTVGKRLPQDPVHRVGGALEARPAPGWTARVEGIAAFVQYEDDQNTLPLGTQFRLDAYVARTLGRAVELYAAVENVLDRRDLVGRAGVNTISGPFTVRLGVRLRSWEAAGSGP